MITVSQDKTKIVNFDNIAHIFISKDSEKHYLIEYGKMNGSSELLGIYVTEERAKEVLQEIIKVYKFYNGKIYYVEDEKKLLGKYEYGVYEIPKE